MDQSAIGTDADLSLNESTPSSQSSNNDTHVPALGRYWQSICSLRLLIKRSNDPKLIDSTASSQQRIIRIIKTNQLKTDNFCMVSLSDSGFS